jgi:5-guanidino-2-oxopentanoate decarboxylase
MTTFELAPSVADDERAAATAAGVAIENAGLAVLTTLRAYGIDTIFGIPGTHNLEFYRHLRRLGIRAVTSRHEQGAGYAADGWAQRRGLPGVVITTSGPGLLNALSAAGTAYCESRPLILLSPGVAVGDEFADTGTLHETKDATGAAGAIVEWSRRVATAADAVEAVHDAFELFRTGRPRPVHIEVPLDVLERTADLDPELLAPRPHPEPSAAGADEVVRAAAALAAASRPVILAGGGAARVGSSLTALAERLGAPVVTTLNGKGSIPESHALALGAELRLHEAREVANRSDVLLVIGAKVGEAELWGGVIDPDGSVVRVDVLGSQLQKNVASDIGLVGHAEAVVPQLLSALETVGHRPAESSWLDLDAVRARCAVEAAGFSPTVAAAAADIAAALPDDVIVAGDSSQITYLGMTSAVRQDASHSFLYTPAYATLGYGLPAAIGARVADPDRPVVCVVGDGALMFAVQELATAVEQALDLTVVCVDNNGYGEIRQNEIDRGIDPIGVQLAQPDWAALADAFGGRGHRVADRAEVGDTIARALATPGLDLVHIPLAVYREAAAAALDPEQNR